MQPLQRLEQWLRSRHQSNESRLYPSGAFRSLVPELNSGAYRGLLRRAEQRGLIERVCQGVYQYTGAPDQSGYILFHAAAILRARHFNYISLETVLSDAGIISQIPIAWVTIVSTGRSGHVSCGRYGTIEFVHTERPMSRVVDELHYNPERHMYQASSELALEDMHRFHRSTLNLVQENNDDRF